MILEVRKTFQQKKNKRNGRKLKGKETNDIESEVCH